MSSDKYSDEIVFEINDFSTSTPWESFIANIEEILLEWRNEPVIHNEHCVKQGNRCIHTRSEDITFGDEQLHFTFVYYNLYSSSDPSNLIDHQFWLDSFSFECDITNIFKWFSLSEFAVLKPKSIGSEVSRSESALNFVLSSASVALNNTGSDLPVFVQGNQPSGPVYYGQRLRLGFLTLHDTIHLSHIPASFRHLSGLCDLFISKLNCSSTPAIQVSVRFTYFLLNSAPPLVQSLSLVDAPRDSRGVKDNNTYQLPFGRAENTISSLGLFASWHNTPFQNIVDNDVYSDLEHNNAHECHLVVNRAPVVDGNLQVTVQQFLDLSTVDTPMSDLITRYLIRPPSEEADLADAFSPLTGQTAAINLLNFKVTNSPLNGVTLAPMMSYIFPDGWRGNAWYPNEGQVFEYELTPVDNGQRGQMKACPLDSLLSRLVRVMALVNTQHCRHNNYDYLANVWHEFNMEIQARWRAPTTRSIVGLQTGSPNMSYCLLYQKLQMLNCCVERTRSRNKAAWCMSSSSTSTRTPAGANVDKGEGNPGEEVEANNVHDTPSKNRRNSSSSSSSWRRRSSSSNRNNSSGGDGSVCGGVSGDGVSGDGVSGDGVSGGGGRRRSSSSSSDCDNDEFYECEDMNSMEANNRDKAEGRLHVYNNLRLLDGNKEVKDSTQPLLYVPVTQNSGPLTEDMLEEQADLLSRLGTSSEGAHLRARMQSAGLHSDMESFKAANPGCQLADFVRWYSPRDWTLDLVTGQGTLSGRMLIEGNLWQNLWSSARNNPVSRQKRLFDDTKEAEKILHWLSSLTMSQVSKLLMPVLLQETLVTLNNKIEYTTSVKLKSIVSTMCCHAEQLTRDNLGSYQIFCSNLGEVERLIEQNIRLVDMLRSCNLYEEDGGDGEQGVSSHSATPSTTLTSTRKPSSSGGGGPQTSRKRGSRCTCQSTVTLRDLSTLLLESPYAKIDKCFKCNSYLDGIFSDKKQLWHREYMLRCEASLPSPLSRPSPQRLYASITPKEQLIAGSFCKDTTFK